MLKSSTINTCFFLLVLVLMIADVFGGVNVWLYIIAGLIFISFHVYGSIYLAAEFFVPVKFKGAHDSGAVALSFDDGPLPEKTERILEILKLHKVRATFFCIGHRVAANPDIVRRINHEGHILGNHSYWHGRLFDLQLPEKIADELKQTDTVIEKSVGKKLRFFRPPYGVTNPMVASAIKAGNYVTIGWSLRSFDTMTKDSSKLLQRLTSRVKSGDIVLFHDYSDAMLEILPAFLDHLNQVGLKIVNVDELLNEKAYV